MEIFNYDQNREQRHTNAIPTIYQRRYKTGTKPVLSLYYTGTTPSLSRIKAVQGSFSPNNSQNYGR